MMERCCVYVEGADKMNIRALEKRLKEIRKEYGVKYSEYCKQFEHIKSSRERAKKGLTFYNTDDGKIYNELGYLVQWCDKEGDRISQEQFDKDMAEHDAWTAKFKAIVEGMEAFNRACESRYLK